MISLYVNLIPSISEARPIVADYAESNCWRLKRKLVGQINATYLFADSIIIYNYPECKRTLQSLDSRYYSD